MTGTWDFGADQALKMPESTLRLALVQAEVSHANIKGVDTSEAEKMPGVFKVITAKDVPGKNRINGLVMLPLNNKCDGWDRPILCDEKVFQYGDAIAIVAADTEEHAREAAKAVKVDLEVLPAYMSAPEALAPDAIEIHPGTPTPTTRPTASRARTSTSIPPPTSSRSRATARASPTSTSSPTTATPTSTRTACSPCTPSPSVSTCTCP